MSLDPAIARALALTSATATTVSRHGGSGFSSTSRITATPASGARQEFFMKTAPGPDAEIMFRGEHASLNAIHAVVPSLCPRSFAHGVLDQSPATAFLVTDYLHLASRSREETADDGGPSSGLSLAAKLGELHTTPAPAPEGCSAPMFGFPVPTCCGDTRQENSYREDWAEFFAHNRLLAIVDRCERANGSDPELRALVESVAAHTVPRLLRHGHHLDRGKRVAPVVVHGDLWSGNKGRGVIGGASGGVEEVVFDPSACYASSEYEWGIMKMFGGFDKAFEKEYHAIRPKMEPVEEYDDRIRLYGLYHQLNHATIFGQSYRAGAVSIMRDLLRKYGGKK